MVFRGLILLVVVLLQIMFTIREVLVYPTLEMMIYLLPFLYLVKQDHQDHRVLPDQAVVQVLPDQAVVQVLPDLVELVDHQVHLVNQDQVDHPVVQVLPDQVDHLVQVDHQGLVVQVVHPVVQVLQDLVVLQDHQDLVVRQVFLVWMVLIAVDGFIIQVILTMSIQVLVDFLRMLLQHRLFQLL